MFAMIVGSVVGLAEIYHSLDRTMNTLKLRDGIIDRSPETQTIVQRRNDTSKAGRTNKTSETRRLGVQVARLLYAGSLLLLTYYQLVNLNISKVSILHQI